MNRSIRAGLLLLLIAGPAFGQRPTLDAKPPAPPAPACDRFAAAQTAVYAPYVRLIAAELPDPAKVQDREQMGRDLEALYARQVEAAKAGDEQAFRKAIGLELFGTQIRRQPALDITQRKLCVLAREASRPTMSDMLACAVTSLDGPRRERPGSKDLARQMIEKAKASIPADANAADTGKLLYDDVLRSLSGCY